MSPEYSSTVASPKCLSCKGDIAGAKGAGPYQVRKKLEGARKREGKCRDEGDGQAIGSEEAGEEDDPIMTGPAAQIVGRRRKNTWHGRCEGGGSSPLEASPGKGGMRKFAWGKEVGGRRGFEAGPTFALKK